MADDWDVDNTRRLNDHEARLAWLEAIVGVGDHVRRLADLIDRIERLDTR